MGLESICDVCQSPMCAFSHRYDGTRICVHCRSIERIGTPEPKVFRALGVLVAQHRGYAIDAMAQAICGQRETGLRQKTLALIKHDRILRGEA